MKVSNSQLVLLVAYATNIYISSDLAKLHVIVMISYHIVYQINFNVQFYITCLVIVTGWTLRLLHCTVRLLPIAIGATLIVCDGGDVTTQSPPLFHVHSEIFHTLLLCWKGLQMTANSTILQETHRKSIRVNVWNSGAIFDTVPCGMCENGRPCGWAGKPDSHRWWGGMVRNWQIAFFLVFIPGFIRDHVYSLLFSTPSSTNICL